jgi:hypothetical protein
LAHTYKRRRKEGKKNMKRLGNIRKSAREQKVRRSGRLA